MYGGTGLELGGAGLKAFWKRWKSPLKKVQKRMPAEELVLDAKSKLESQQDHGCAVAGKNF